MNKKTLVDLNKLIELNKAAQDGYLMAVKGCDSPVAFDDKIA